MLAHLRPATLIALGLGLGLGTTACDDSDGAASSPATTTDAGESPAADGGSARSTEGNAGKAAARPDASATKPDAGEPDAATAGELPVKLRFRAQVGDEPFACGRSYRAQGSTSQTVVPRDLRMFIQDVALVDDAGQEVPVKLDTRDPWQTPEVALLDFEDATGECFGDAETNAEIRGVVPPGKYRALRFTNGVPDKLNHSDPKTFPPPLKTPGMSWNWLLGLRFLRFETATQLDADADAGAAAASFALHIGSTACAGSQNQGNITCAKPNRSRVELTDFDLAKSEIVLDVSKLLQGNDLSKTVECHSASPSCVAPFQALGVSYETGKPAATASAFRLE